MVGEESMEKSTLWIEGEHREQPNVPGYIPIIVSVFWKLTLMLASPHTRSGEIRNGTTASPDSQIGVNLADT